MLRHGLREKEKKTLRDERKIDWTYPICAEVLPNSTWKITNGQNKGMTLKAKDVRYIMQIEREITDDSEVEVSSTEERVRKGEETSWVWQAVYRVDVGVLYTTHQKLQL